MKENKRRLLILSFFIFLIVPSFLFLYKKFSNSEVTIFLAAQDIPKGVYLKPDMLLPVRVSQGQVSWKAVHNFQEVSGLNTLVPIRKGEPILYDQMSPTAKAFSPLCGRNPQSYFLTVDENTWVGKLYPPGADLYFCGHMSDKTIEKPLAVFSKVVVVYQNGQSEKGLSKNPVQVFLVTPDQAQTLTNLKAQSLRL